MAATYTYTQGAKAPREIFLRPRLMAFVPLGLRKSGIGVLPRNPTVLGG